MLKELEDWDRQPNARPVGRTETPPPLGWRVGETLGRQESSWLPWVGVVLVVAGAICSVVGGLTISRWIYEAVAR